MKILTEEKKQQLLDSLATNQQFLGRLNSKRSKSYDEQTIERFELEAYEKEGYEYEEYEAYSTTSSQCNITSSDESDSTSYTTSSGAPSTSSSTVKISTANPDPLGNFITPS